MALDSEGITTVAKLQLNADGFLVSAGNALVIPYLNGAYDLFLFRTEAEADANDINNAIQLADNILGIPADDAIETLLINDLSQAYEFPTVAAMKASVTLPERKLIKTNGYYNGWAALLLPQGSAEYLVTTLQDVRDTINDQAWVPDEFGDHTRFDGSIAKLQKLSTIKAEQYGIKKDGTNDSPALNAALATKLNVECGSGKISLADPVQIKYNGQSLFGHGTYNTDLEWIGTDNTKNMIELWSGRRDLANDSLAVTNQRFENFKVSTKTGSLINNVIWVEAGCFHGWIEKIRGFDLRGGVPQEAILKFDSNGGQSYALGMKVSDCVFTGGINDDLVPFPRGIWLESVIEGLFTNVKVFTCEQTWVLGTSEVANIRNVVDTTFIQCQGEIGDRGFATDNARSLVMYQGRNLTFLSCKYMAAADFTSSTNQVPLRFSGAGDFQNKNINFIACTIWGVQYAQNALVFDSNVNYQGVRFKGCEFLGFEGALMTVDGDDIPLVEFDEFNSYVQCEATPADFRIESVARLGFTINNADGNTISLQSGNDTAQVKRESGILFSHTDDTVGLIMSAYKFSSQQVRIRAYNRSGGAITLTDGYFYTREIDVHNSSLQGRITFNPPSMAAFASTSTTVNVLGAKLGDFVCVNFSLDNEDVNVIGYVSADDVVTVRFVNRTGSVRDLGAGILSAYILSGVITSSAKVVYDAPSLAANVGTTTTVTVAGAKVSDIAVYSLGLDQQGVVGYAWVSAADTVSVRFQNESGGIVDLASTTIKVGVIEKPTSM